MFNVIRHIKNYEGDLIRNGSNIDFYRFADEREWRHVPPLTTKLFPVEPENRIDTKEKKKALAEFALPYALPYAVEDISYIIVPTEKNIRPIKQLIQDCFSEDDAQIEHLLTNSDSRADFRRSIGSRDRNDGSVLPPAAYYELPSRPAGNSGCNTVNCKSAGKIA